MRPHRSCRRSELGDARGERPHHDHEDPSAAAAAMTTSVPVSMR